MKIENATKEESLSQLEEMYNLAKQAIEANKPVMIFQSIDMGKEYHQQTMVRYLSVQHCRDFKDFAKETIKQYFIRPSI